MKMFSKPLSYLVLGITYSAVVCLILVVLYFSNYEIPFFLTYINGFLMLVVMSCAFVKNNVKVSRIVLYSLMILAVVFVITFVFMTVWHKILLAESAKANTEVWENPNRRTLDLGIGLYMVIAAELLIHSYIFVPVSTVVGVVVNTVKSRKVKESD